MDITADNNFLFSEYMLTTKPFFELDSGSFSLFSGFYSDSCNIEKTIPEKRLRAGFDQFGTIFFNSKPRKNKVALE